jgi:hypothetical protein
LIGGLFVDVCMLAAIALFGWAGGQLGGTASLVRTLSALGALAVAVLVCDPMGSLMAAVTGAGEEVARVLGIGVSGIAGWFAFRAMLRWWLARRQARRFEPDWDVQLPDPLERQSVAIAAGVVFGLSWTALFLGMLVMLPGDTPISRAAVASNTGGLLIRHDGILRWLDGQFPHYTQTLPKGKAGAVVGEVGTLPMRGDDAVHDVPLDADVMVRSINALRADADVQTVAPNRRIATVAQRHARSLAQDHVLSLQVPGDGGPLTPQVIAALGSESPNFDARPGVRVVWAHSPGNAVAGLVADGRTGALLVDPKCSEIGVGVADAGWFNGRIYVVILIASAQSPTADASTSGVDTGSTSTPAG